MRRGWDAGAKHSFAGSLQTHIPLAPPALPGHVLGGNSLILSAMAWEVVNHHSVPLAKAASFQLCLHPARGLLHLSPSEVVSRAGRDTSNPAHVPGASSHECPGTKRFVRTQQADRLQITNTAAC